MKKNNYMLSKLAIIIVWLIINYLEIAMYSYVNKSKNIAMNSYVNKNKIKN